MSADNTAADDTIVQTPHVVGRVHVISVVYHLCVCSTRRQWGMVGHFKDTINARKDRPRVGKAISVLMDLDPEVVDEWFV